MAVPVPKPVTVNDGDPIELVTVVVVIPPKVVEVTITWTLVIVVTVEEAMEVKAVLVANAVKRGDGIVSDGYTELVIVTSIVLPLSETLPVTPAGRMSAGAVKVPPVMLVN